MSGLEVDFIQLTLTEAKAAPGPVGLTGELRQALVNLRLEDPGRGLSSAVEEESSCEPEDEESDSIWTVAELNKLVRYSGWSRSELQAIFPAGTPQLRARYRELQGVGTVYLDQLEQLQRRRATTDGATWAVPLPWTRIMVLALSEPEPIEQYWTIAPHLAAPALGMIIPPDSSASWYHEHLFEYADAACDQALDEEVGLYLARRFALATVSDELLRSAVGSGAPYGKAALLRALPPPTERWLLRGEQIGLGQGAARTWFKASALLQTVERDGSLPGYIDVRLADDELVELAKIKMFAPTVGRVRLRRRKMESQWNQIKAEFATFDSGAQAGIRSLLQLVPINIGVGKDMDIWRLELQQWITDLPALLIEFQTSQIHQWLPNRSGTIGQQAQQMSTRDSYRGWLRLLRP